jgi:hypothetical protein
MDEAHALLARLDRIEALDREGAPPQLLLPELQALVREAEAWARRERDPRAEAAAAACATACDAVLGDAIVPA